MRSFVLVVLAALAAPLAMPLGAQRAEVVMPDVGLRVEASMNWPLLCSKGFVPIELRVENENASPESIDIALGRWSDSSSSKRSFVAPPGVSEFTLLFPAFERTRSGYRGMHTSELELEVRSGLRPETMWGAGSYLMASEVPIACYLALTEKLTATSDVEGWSRAVGSEHTPTFGTPYLDVSGAAVAFDEAPLRFEPYTSLDAVVIDTRSGLPAEEVLAAVLRYTRLGGTVVFLGPDATSLVEARPDVGPFDPRLSGRADAIPAARVVAHGLGVLATLDTPDDEAQLLEDPASRALFEWALHRHPTPAPTKPPPSGTRSGPPLDDLDRGPFIPGLQRIPYRTMLLGLGLFAVLIGPINFYVMRRLGRPMLLTLTIPGIALCASLLILGIGFWSAGIDNRTAEYGYTVLDQRAHRASTVMLRSLWCGLSPSPLRPGAGSALLPEQHGSRAEQNLGYQLDESDGLVLTGDFLPVRRSLKQTLFTDRTFRGRVVLESADGAWRATNGLGVDIDVFVFRAVDGSYHRLEAPLADGATATLEATERAAPSRAAWLTFAERLRQVGYPDLPAMVAGRAIDDEVRAAYERQLASFELPTGAYLALFDEANPAVDDMGLETRAAFARHVILGLVEGGSER